MNQAERLLVCGFNPNPSASPGKHASQCLRERPATAHPEAGGQEAALTHGRENNHALPGQGRPGPHHRHTIPEWKLQWKPHSFHSSPVPCKARLPWQGLLASTFPSHPRKRGITSSLLAWSSVQTGSASAGTSGAVCSLCVSSSPESKTKIPRISQGRQQGTL